MSKNCSVVSKKECRASFRRLEAPLSEVEVFNLLPYPRLIYRSMLAKNKINFVKNGRRNC